MLVLSNTTKITAVLAGAVTTNELPVTVTYLDISTSDLTDLTPVASDVELTTGTTTKDVIGSPSSGKVRQVKSISVYNADTADATITIRLYDGSNNRQQYKATLSAGETLQYTQDKGFFTDSSGSISVVVSELGDIENVTITSITSGEITQWNGTAWVNRTLSEAGIAAASHNHNASDINAGTLAHERGGLEADVSAFDGLVKISGGSTSAVAQSTFATASHNHNASDINAGTLAVARGGTGGGDAATARTNLGLETVGQVEAEAGTATTVRAWTAERVKQAIAALASSGAAAGEFPRGCTISNAADADHDITVTEGFRYTGSEGIYLPVDRTKRIDASWTAGSGQGGLSSSLTLLPDTTYHIHLIVVGAAPDWGFDTSLTAANLIADHSATAYAPVASVLTDASSNIKAFTQIGDYFRWKVQPREFFVNAPGSSAALRDLQVPTGRKVISVADYTLYATSLDYALFTDPDEPATTPSGTAWHLFATSSYTRSFAVLDTPTSTSGQVRTQCSNGASPTQISATLLGYRDPWYQGVKTDDS